MRSIYISLLTILLMAASSCNKYLDVQPEDRFLDQQVYGNRTSILNALNGIYLRMAKAEMYGENLTTTTVDVLAQLYACPATTDDFYTLARYNYTDARSRARLQQTWNASYSAILNINLFLYNVGAGSGILTEQDKALLMGEAYGLRAFIAFDMLRLFGPVYSLQPQAASIPYPNTPGTEIPAQLPASVVADSVLRDLQKAGTLLAQDPVITEGVKAMANDNSDNFFRMRNRRMNYYAVKALEARVQLYKGNKTAALAAANAVITAASKWFPWSPATASSPGITNPDRIFSSEVIFGMDNAKLYDMHSKWFSVAQTTNKLIPLATRLNGIYNNFPNDYRFRTQFEVDRFTNTTDKSFFKFADVADKTLRYRFFQPLIRMTEMYYIVAECEPDQAKANTALNTVLYNRGLPDVVLATDRGPQIRSEYEKEFWGEGQLFFYYKRMFITTVPSGVTAGANVTLSQDQYVLPLPLSETEFR